VQRYGGVPPYYETEHYVLKVLRAWNVLRSTVRIPKSAWLAATEQGHAPDVDYWTDDSGH